MKTLNGRAGFDGVKINKSTNIFIVDDNRIFALALKVYLQNAFENRIINIYLFETGEKCMELFMQLLPEFVILDFSLNSIAPDAADGLEVLEKIKMGNPETCVIMMTSNNLIDTALKSFHKGASDYVIKSTSQFKKINESISTIFANKDKRAAEQDIAARAFNFQNSENEKRTWELNAVRVQKAEVEKSKFLLEEKNKDITDSLNYARRIQQAQLPRIEEIYASLPNSFILFKPKDIVSGDFYFFHKNHDRVFIVAADCTGHGVPGAFMSMIGSEKLTDAVLQSSDTSEILNHLNRGIKNSLHQSEHVDSTRDGMDIAICSIDTKNKTLKYAGANRPLWIIRNGKTEVEEIKGTKKAIGGLTDDNQHFDSHELQMQEGDTFYIFSDGYADTFGGLYGKKLLSKNLKKLIIRIQDRSMPEQEKYLNDFLENWKAEKEQIDDILVIGVRC